MNEIEEVNSVFEQPWWLDIVAENLWDELIIKDKKGACIGRLPYAKLHLKGINYYGNPMLTQQLGPWIKKMPDFKPVKFSSYTKQVIEQLIDLLSQKANVDLSFNVNFKYVLPFIWAGYTVEPKFTYIIKNLSNLKEVFMNMDSKVRNIIKKAEKEVEISYEISENELITLLKDTFHKQGRTLPMNEDIIRKIYRETLKRNAGKIIGAIDKTGRTIAVAFFLYDKNTCFYLLGGKDYNSHVKGAQEILLWEGIKFASENSKFFDFEGSMIKGIESFFRGFGGEACVYYRVRKGNMLFDLLNLSKPYVKKILGYK